MADCAYSGTEFAFDEAGGFMADTSDRSALVRSLWSGDAGRVTRDVILVIAGTALIAIAARIKVPFYPVPMTLQTLAIMLVAATYGFRLGTITVLAYLLEGALGLPVFTNTPPQVAGPAYFLGTTGGFLAGFVALAAIVGYATDRGWDRSIAKLFAALIVGEVVMFALGFGWLAWFASLSSGATGLGVAKAWAGGVAPFLLGDLLKIVVASLAVPAAWMLAGRRDA
jgi:biotin transport system substrate-specific component